MNADRTSMTKLTRGLGSKSAKMRALAHAGYRQADIARFLDTPPQFVSNVLSAERAKAGKTALEPEARRSFKVRLGPDGRVVIPAELRQALGLAEGDVLFARLDDGELHLLTPAAAMRRAQKIIRKFVPEGVSLVDELIEDRRREAEREQHDG